MPTPCRTYNITSKFDYQHTLGIENFCSWLDEHYCDQSLVTPDSIFTWCFNQNQAQLTAVLQPVFQEFYEQTGQRVHIAWLAMMSTENESGVRAIIDVDRYGSID